MEYHAVTFNVIWQPNIKAFLPCFYFRTLIPGGTMSLSWLMFTQWFIKVYLSNCYVVIPKIFSFQKINLQVLSSSHSTAESDKWSYDTWQSLATSEVHPLRCSVSPYIHFRSLGVLRHLSYDQLNMLICLSKFHHSPRGLIYQVVESWRSTLCADWSIGKCNELVCQPHTWASRNWQDLPCSHNGLWADQSSRDQRTFAWKGGPLCVEALASALNELCLFFLPWYQL